MVDWLTRFVMAFVPLFVAVDPIGILPLFLGLTEGMERAHRRRVIRQSMITAMAVAVAFILVGRSIFVLLGITVSDFMVAGGSLLFIIATLDLASGTKSYRQTDMTVGAVPLGTPLIAGPATLTTAMLLVGTYGPDVTIAAVVVNIILAGLVFLTANFWMRLLGLSWTRAITKIVSLILAAIAVMMVRRGLEQIIISFRQIEGAT